MPELTVSLTQRRDVQVVGAGFPPSLEMVTERNLDGSEREVPVYHLVSLRVRTPGIGRVFGESAEVADDGSFSRDVAIDVAQHSDLDPYVVQVYPFGEETTPLAEWSGVLGEPPEPPDTTP